MIKSEGEHVGTVMLELSVTRLGHWAMMRWLMIVCTQVPYSNKVCESTHQQTWGCYGALQGQYRALPGTTAITKVC